MRKQMEQLGVRRSRVIAIGLVAVIVSPALIVFEVVALAGTIVAIPFARSLRSQFVEVALGLSIAVLLYIALVLVFLVFA